MIRFGNIIKDKAPNAIYFDMTSSQIIKIRKTQQQETYRQ